MAIPMTLLSLPCNSSITFFTSEHGLKGWVMFALLWNVFTLQLALNSLKQLVTDECIVSASWIHLTVPGHLANVKLVLKQLCDVTPGKRPTSLWFFTILL